MKKGGWIALVIVLLVLFFFLFGYTESFSGLIYNIANHMVSFLLILLIIGSFVYACVQSSDTGENRHFWWPVLFIFAWVFVLVIQGPVTRYGLYLHTEYLPNDTLVAQDETRDVPYTVAATNFVGTNPDAMSQPGDLDYVQKKWIASIDPKGFWNRLAKDSKGFFVYDPDSSDKVVRIIQTMPFAENGWWWNSSAWFVKSKAYFSEFHEVLYVQDPESGETIAVISLIKRQGFSRYPYVDSVMIVHSNGRVEHLTVEQAEADPRLTDIALKPEWLANEEVRAYGYRYGVLNAVFTRQGRIQVQTSSVNDENSAPFHLATQNGNMWVTPYSPLKATSLLGIASTSSHDVNGPVYIWQLPEGQAYLGADRLASLVEGAPSHRNINWFRSSSTDDGAKITCGNMTVLEMIPVVRAEPDGNHLYFLGYTSTAPNSVIVSFYTIVDPKTQTVYKDIMSDGEVEAWLRGEFELQPVSSETDTVDVAPAGECVFSEAFETQSTGDLFDLVDSILNEIEIRANK